MATRWCEACTLGEHIKCSGVAEQDGIKSRCLCPYCNHDTDHA